MKMVTFFVLVLNLMVNHLVSSFEPDPGCFEPINDNSACEEPIPKFYYNSVTRYCERFQQGTCKGQSKNSFDSQMECEKACVDVCRLPSLVGPCKAYTYNFFYDNEEGVCNNFVYGGCEGNGNNFQTLEECNNRCSRVENEEDTVVF